jgi:hypothetical protein
LSGLQFHYRGGGTAEQAARVVPEFEKAYPDPHVFGVMPAWGVFARHVKNLRMHDVELRVLSDDQRPAVFFEDVTNARCRDVELRGMEGRVLWSLAEVSGFQARDCTALPDEGLPTRIQRSEF